MYRESRGREIEGRAERQRVANIPSAQPFMASFSTQYIYPILLAQRWAQVDTRPTSSHTFCQTLNLEQRMWPESIHPLEGCLDIGQLAIGFNSKALLFNSFFGPLWILPIRQFALRSASLSCNCNRLTGVGWQDRARKSHKGRWVKVNNPQ